LSFHLPFFALRDHPLPKDSPRKVQGKPLRRWRDLSFLRTQTSGSESEERYGIYEAEISCVVAGSDNWRWIAFAFVDTYFDGGESDDSVMWYGCEEAIHLDPILAGNLDANMPIWKPREYFMKVFEIRILQVIKEWDFLVLTVKRSIEVYVCCPALSFVTLRTLEPHL
jgi:hypothetical protein